MARLVAVFCCRILRPLLPGRSDQRNRWRLDAIRCKLAPGLALDQFDHLRHHGVETAGLVEVLAGYRHHRVAREQKLTVAALVVHDF